MGRSFIIGGFNDADEVIKAEHRVLTHDRATKGGNLIFHTFGALAKFEHSQVVQRTRDGMRQARARGIRSGPKLKLSAAQLDRARALIEEGQSRENIAGLFGVSRVTLWRALVA
jgi:DNA invertase Pin-like site-specific DNA recombinase